jgi:Rho GDP-dissociation inhibitor
MSLEQENFPDEQEIVENYKAPPQKTIDELLKLDNEDASLRKYKEALLGSHVDKIIVDANNPKNVIVKRLVLVVEGRDDMVLDLSGDLSQLKKAQFSIKEGIQYKIR